jgi:hypothetical protein
MVELQERPPELAADEPLTALSSVFGDANLRDKVQRLEDIMFQMPGHVTELPTRHVFARGLYARELTIPKGMVASGKVHCQEHIFIVSKGDISVLTEDGPQRVQAPYILVTQPGTKRVVFAHEETVVTTVHATTETDVKALESELVVSSFEEYEVRRLASPGD